MFTEMTNQVFDLLPQKHNKVTFEDYLKSIGTQELLDITNQYEAARFIYKDNLCIIYYKPTKSKFSYSNNLARHIHNDWQKEPLKRKTPNGKDKEKHKVLLLVEELLGDLMIDPGFVKYINDEYDSDFRIKKFYEWMYTIEDIRVAYKCILQYRRIFLNEGDIS